MKKIKALILDMDGVLWRSNEALGDLPAIFAQITQQGLKVTLATNNSSRTLPQHLEKIAHFGVKLNKGQILSSAIAVAARLQDDFPNGGAVYIIGHDGIMDALAQKDFRVYQEDEMPENPVAVVAGIDWEINYKKLANATTLIRKGATFYGTNPDKTFPTPQGLMPGAGTILAALETASGVSPIVAGKPEPYLFQVAMRQMDVMPEETLVVGDRLETDILGAQNAGCQTALVLSGVTTRAAAEKWQPTPTYIAKNLTALLKKIE